VTHPSTDPPDAAFTPVEQARSSQRIADVIRRTILDGRFRPGEQLPPERTLAERFGVTRNTVREALRNLEQLRLVAIRHGSGVTVQDYLATAGIELVSALLLPEQGATAELFDDLLEARRVVGQAMCLHAIDLVRRGSHAELTDAVASFAAEAARDRPDVPRLLSLDFDVQNQLIRVAGNRVFVLLHNSLRHVYERAAARFTPLMSEPRAVAAGYQDLLTALKSGDREAARAAVMLVYEKTSPKRRTRR
jgi:fatty acid metabolism transcriptional regulator FadR